VTGLSTGRLLPAGRAGWRGGHAATRTPAGQPRLPAGEIAAHQQPIRGAWPLLAISAVYFVITYFEMMNLLGFKFATLWRFVVVVVAAAVIAARPFRLDETGRALEPVFWAFLAFAMAPLVSIAVGSSDAQVSLEVFAQRIFPIIVVLLMLGAARFDLADLLVRGFPVYLCLVSVPLLLGWLEPLAPPLEAVGGSEVNAYPSAFQNVHSAALAHAIAVICLFTLLVKSSGRHVRWLLPGVLACLVLTIITTARSGLLAAILGMMVIASLSGRLKTLLVLCGLTMLVASLVTLARPQLADVAVDRLLGRNAYVVDYSADAMSSGRLTLQRAALEAFADQPPLRQMFGLGRTESKKAIARYSSHYLIAHNAFVDELIAYGVFGLCTLVVAMAAAFRVAWHNARAGHPAGFALVLSMLVFAVLQGIDYSLQLSVAGLVLLLETRARVRQRPVAPPAALPRSTAS
jgi:O-antigen ligase